jgi:ABC-type phosphate transport system permease subunit
MRMNPDPFRLPNGRGQPPGLFARILATVAASGLFVLAFMVSAFVLAGALALGLLAWGWFWWNTRAMRRALREQMRNASPGSQASGGREIAIIEGEVIRDADANERRSPP